MCANGAETPRLLFLSASAQFPDGLANSSGMVGKNLMFNGSSNAAGLFPEEINAHKSIATTRVIHDISMEMLDAVGAIKKVGSYARNGQTGGVHLLGTCRMGNDPATSVVDRYNRSHDVPNLFMVDGGSMVTSGRGQPTMTIMALVFRAADHIIQAARRNEI